jgi:ABC-2 type transport system ATP-binding protein
LTLVIATPYLDEAERCSRVLLVDEGRVLADARPKDLVALLPGTLLDVNAAPRRLVASVLAGVPGVRDVQPFAARFHVRMEGEGDSAGAVRAALEAAGAVVEDVQVTKPRLEDTFLFLTRSNDPPADEKAGPGNGGAP